MAADGPNDHWHSPERAAFFPGVGVSPRNVATQQQKPRSGGTSQARTGMSPLRGSWTQIWTRCAGLRPRLCGVPPVPGYLDDINAW